MNSSPESQWLTIPENSYHETFLASLRTGETIHDHLTVMLGQLRFLPPFCCDWLERCGVGLGRAECQIHSSQSFSNPCRQRACPPRCWLIFARGVGERLLFAKKKPNCQLGRPLRIFLVRLAKFFFPSLPHWSSKNDRNSDKNGGGGERNQRCPFERQYRDQVKSRSRAEDCPADRGGWILWSYSNYVRFRSNVLYRSFWSQTVFLFTVRIGQRAICRH